MFASEGPVDLANPRRPPHGSPVSAPKDGAVDYPGFHAETRSKGIRSLVSMREAGQTRPHVRPGKGRLGEITKGRSDTLGRRSRPIRCSSGIGQEVSRVSASPLYPPRP